MSEKTINFGDKEINKNNKTKTKTTFTTTKSNLI